MSYERKDASLTVIGVGAGLFLLLFWGSIWVAAWFYREHFGPTQGFPAAGRQTSFTLGPESKPDTEKSWQEVQAAARQLDSYGWIDRNQGIARIPIERAMQLMASGTQPVPFPPASAAVKDAESTQDRTPMPRIK